jgi:hypothetical protein|tara:strand:- start:51 stop:572 length:522 start_codon:yes stop_codon:yes gene_type:complete
MPGHYNKKDPNGQIKPAASKIVQAWRQFKNNPKYSFHRNIATGLTFLPIGRAVGAGVNLIKSRIGVGVGTKLGSAAVKAMKSEHIAPSLNTNRIAQSFVDKQIKHLTKDIPKIGKTGFPSGSYMDKFHSNTGLTKTFFDAAARNTGATSRTGGTFPFIPGTGRIKNPLKQFDK